MRRVFDVCHGCRRCFNLCQSFPTLFDMIDNSPSGELNSVDSSEFKKVRGLWYQSCLQWPTHVCAYSILQVSDECTLCDMCFINKCAYTAVAAIFAFIKTQVSIHSASPTQRRLSSPHSALSRRWC